MKDWRGRAFFRKPFPLQSSPFPSQRLSTGGEADQHEFLPDNSFWEKQYGGKFNLFAVFFEMSRFMGKWKCVAFFYCP